MTMFLAKYDASGNQVWLKIFGQNTSGSKSARAVVHLNDEIYVAGNTNGNYNSQNVLRAGTNDVILMKYDLDGNIQWSKLVGSVESENVLGLRAGPDGRIHLFGQTHGDFDGLANGNDLVNASGTARKSAVFVVRYNQTGAKENSFLLEDTDIRSANLEIDVNSIYHISSVQAVDVDPAVPHFKRRPVKFQYSQAGSLITTQFGEWYESNGGSTNGVETYAHFFSGSAYGIGCYSRASTTFTDSTGDGRIFTTQILPQAW